MAGPRQDDVAHAAQVERDFEALTDVTLEIAPSVASVPRSQVDSPGNIDTAAAPISGPTSRNENQVAEILCAAELPVREAPNDGPDRANISAGSPRIKIDAPSDTTPRGAFGLEQSESNFAAEVPVGEKHPESGNTYTAVTVPRSLIPIQRIPPPQSDQANLESRKVVGFVETISTNEMSGWALDKADASPLLIQAMLDDELVGQGWADEFRADLQAKYGTDGNHRFVMFTIRELDDAEVAGLVIFAIDINNIRHELPRIGSAVERPFSIHRLRRFARIILHIGIEKTGSTSLQRFLTVNQDDLRARGYFVPSSFAPVAAPPLFNHTYLTTCSMKSDRLDDEIRVQNGISDRRSLIRHRFDITRKFEQEITELSDSVDTIILTNEHMFSQLRTAEEIYYLRDWLRIFSNNIDVVVYLRPQHEVAMSLHSTALRNGWTTPSPFLLTDQVGNGQSPIDRQFFEYGDLLRAWVDVFGHDAMKVRLFGPHTLIDGDIVADFFQTLLIDDVGLIPLEGRENVGLTLIGARLLLFLNKMLLTVPEEIARTKRNAVVDALALIASDSRGMRPSRAEARSFFESFKASNEYVRKEWFPHQKELFDVNWERLPEVADPTELAPGDAIQVILSLLGVA